MTGKLVRLLGAALLCACSGVMAQTWQNTLQERDLNGDGRADAYYDTVLDLTWLRNFGDYSVTAPTLPGQQRDDVDHHAATVSFISTLRLFGVDGWRLPSAARSFAWGTVNEMTYLWRVELGLGTGQPPNYPLFGTTNIRGSDGEMLFVWNYEDDYFMDTTDVQFEVGSGGVQPGIPWGVLGMVAQATVVRDGDIAMAVPEPSTYALMAVGLLALVGVHRRRQRIDHAGAAR